MNEQRPRYPLFFQPDVWWRNSYVGRLTSSLKSRANMLWAGLPGRLRFGIKWRGIIEGLIILGVVFMPVLSSWWCLLSLLLLLWATGPANSVRESRAGWLFLWLTLAVSAFFSPGFSTGWPALVRFGSWFGLAWLVGRTFSSGLKTRLLKYLVYTSLIWLSIAFWQLCSGIPTPRGWLEPEQTSVIPVRIYSVFGNPNIFGLYLLSILVLSRYLITECTAKFEKYLLTGILITVLAALYFTYTRMAWFLAVVLLVLPGKGKRRRLSLLITGILIVLLLVLPDFNLRLGSLAHLSGSSLQYRLRIWQGTWQALRDYWLWGSGPGSFSAIYPLYRIGNTVSQHAHQFYLQFWLEHGIFSLAAFLAVLKRILSGCKPVGTSLELKIPVMVLIVFSGYGLSETWYVHQFSGGYFWFWAGLLQVPLPNNKLQG